MHHAMCLDGNSIMFAWAKNAPPTTLPKDVGFKLNPKEKKYLILQVIQNGISLNLKVTISLPIIDLIYITFKPNLV